MSIGNLETIETYCSIDYFIKTDEWPHENYMPSNYENYPNQPPQNVLGARIYFDYPKINSKGNLDQGRGICSIYIGEKYNIDDLKCQLVTQLKVNDNIFNRIALKKLKEYDQKKGQYIALTALGLIQLGYNDDTVSTAEELKQRLDTLYKKYKSISFSIQPKENTPHRKIKLKNE